MHLVSSDYRSASQLSIDAHRPLYAVSRSSHDGDELHVYRKADERSKAAQSKAISESRIQSNGS